MTRVFIVGASRGIGLEFVRKYREAGAEVWATARDDAGLARIPAVQLRRTLAGLAPADNGGPFDHDGTSLAW